MARTKQAARKTTWGQAKKEVSKRKPTGYNLFVKAKITELKEDPSIVAKDRLKIIASMWKELKHEEKDEWNSKADEN